MPATAVCDWVRFVNAEAASLESLAAMPKAVLRGHLRDRMAEAYGFPLQARARWLVVGERTVDELPLSDGTRRALERPTRFLELVPAGITREAASLTGPLLVPCERPLQEGSVLEGILALQDPTKDDLAFPGLLAELGEHEARVAVEP